MENGKGTWEYLRIATPVLTTLGLFIIGMVGSSLGGQINRMDTQLCAKIDKLDDKVFSHLTNEDLHALRSTIVDKAQFDLVNEMRLAQIKDIQSEILSVKTLVIEVREEARCNAKTKQSI